MNEQKISRQHNYQFAGLTVILKIWNTFSHHTQLPALNLIASILFSKQPHETYFP